MLIDRDKAIEAIDEVRDLISVNAYCAITERLKEVPSAEHHKLNIAEYIHDFYPDVWRHAEKELEVQPSAERTGKWVNHRNDGGHNIADCNLCGNTLQWFDNDGEHNYCPNCGARMEGDTE